MVDHPIEARESPGALSGRLTALLAWLALAVFFYAMLRTAWLCDDAYITFRVIDNFVHGYGLRWNVADRVQVFTHPLWMLLLTLPYAWFGDVFRTALVLSIVTSAVAVYLVGFRLASTRAAGLVGVVILFSSKGFVDYSTSGLENPLTYLLLAVFCILSARTFRGTRNVFALTAVAGLAMLDRLDTGLFYLPFLVWGMARNRDRRDWLAAAAGVSPLLLWLAFATFYYGHPFPNTAQAKLGAGIGLTTLLARGLYYLLNSLRWDPITLPTIAVVAVVVGFKGAPRHRLLLLGALLYLAYVIRIGGDFMSGRFLAAPLFCAVCVLVSSGRLRRRSWCLAAAVLALVVGLIAPYPVLSSGSSYGQLRADLIDGHGVADERGFYFWMSGLFNGRGVHNPANLVVTRARNALRCHFPLVVEGGVGFLGFVVGPGVHVVDYHGLGDAVLARLPAVDEDPLYVGFVKNLTQRSPRDAFRIGHYLRAVPPGYLSHLLGHDGSFEDPQLERLVARLDLITRGPLYDTKRIRAILGLNLLHDLPKIDRERYRRWSPPRWEEVIAAAPDSAAGYSSLGEQLYVDGQAVKARAPLEKALELCPEDTEAAYYLAIILWRSGEATRARELCERAVTIDPAMERAHFGLGYIYAGAGETDRAVASFRTAMKLDPGFAAEGYKGIADAYLRAGRSDEARVALEAVVRLSPRDAESRARLGDVLEGLGQRQAAVEAWRAAAALGSARARQKLSRMEQSEGAH